MVLKKGHLRAQWRLREGAQTLRQGSTARLSLTSTGPGEAGREARQRLSKTLWSLPAQSRGQPIRGVWKEQFILKASPATAQRIDRTGPWWNLRAS